VVAHSSQKNPNPISAMKSAHRHQLETNALAQRLDEYIERVRPYAAIVAGAIVGLVVVMFIWSYLSGSSTSRQVAAWDAYHRSVAASPPDLELLRQSAEEYPNTAMQEMANITWADGQVWMAARDYIYNREAAMEALGRATSAYTGILQTSENERLINRAHLGLARVYEMQGELDKAGDEYRKVQGGFTAYARGSVRLALDRQTAAIHSARRPRHPGRGARFFHGRLLSAWRIAGCGRNRRRLGNF
jgi:hypothetical protein